MSINSMFFFVCSTRFTKIFHLSCIFSGMSRICTVSSRKIRGTSYSKSLPIITYLTLVNHRLLLFGNSYISSSSIVSHKARLPNVVVNHKWLIESFMRLLIRSGLLPLNHPTQNRSWWSRSSGQLLFFWTNNLDNTNFFRRSWLSILKWLEYEAWIVNFLVFWWPKMLLSDNVFFLRSDQPSNWIPLLLKRNESVLSPTASAWRCSFFHNKMKIRKSIRTVLDACKTNELALTRNRNKLLFELRAANESLDAYLPDVLLLYKEICRRP